MGAALPTPHRQQNTVIRWAVFCWRGGGGGATSTSPPPASMAVGGSPCSKPFAPRKLRKMQFARRKRPNEMHNRKLRVGTESQFEAETRK
ncbi:hypothetical protein NDU88_006548 [Pleurodeles waltl]|uniref:Uncharacterized protein n=1 Tax=Pleurodeles waltl TaxID=8319 RepID=A0AAV7MCJ5_PLEWA|nr:hypothetical protein NDU88_006548 [Pleurodeles waltl]